MVLKMNMKMTGYKRLLSKYTPQVLEQIRYIADALTLRLKDKLTLSEKEIVRTQLQALTVHADRTSEILDLMRYEWNIFEGDHIRFSFSTSIPLSRAPIRSENLYNLIKAIDTLVEQRSPQRLKFSFDRKRILVQQDKKKPLVIGMRGTYQEGLLRALTDPRIGIIKNAEVVLEIIHSYKSLPALETTADKKSFFRNQMTELQSKLRTVHLGGILTLKWRDNDRNLSLHAKS